MVSLICANDLRWTPIAGGDVVTRFERLDVLLSVRRDDERACRETTWRFADGDERCALTNGGKNRPTPASKERTRSTLRAAFDGGGVGLFGGQLPRWRSQRDELIPDPDHRFGRAELVAGRAPFALPPRLSAPAAAETAPPAATVRRSLRCAPISLAFS